MAQMTSKERMLAAIRLQTPDRVPCTPDFSNMIPCRMTGLPFWEVYYSGRVDLYDAYCRAAKYFGIDGWYQSGVRFKRENAFSVENAVESLTAERMMVRTTLRFPEGELSERTTYYAQDPPTPTEKRVKDIERDFPLIRRLYGRITGMDRGRIEAQRAACGDDGLFCLAVGYPGMHFFTNYMDGGLEAAVYAQSDYPELMDEWAALEHADALRQTEMMLDAKPDCILLGASGTLTLSNPELVRRFCLPSIQAITAMAKQAGVPTMLHSCGKSAALLEMLYAETDLNCINPLEEPPMGDVTLKECKRKYGDRLCLMGNLNTTDVMLRGSPEDVERAARKAIDDAGAGGGFILSTGDQCGRDTPEENLFRLVETAKTYGKYE